MHFLKKHTYPILITIIVIFICWLNYKPGTFLSGWDTLHPEFNFGLNFQRMLSGVWRSEQGLGAVSGHSAMADLPRVIILWILHFILPLSALRYTYIFACLLFGPLGMYYLIVYLCKLTGANGQGSRQRAVAGIHNEHWREGNSRQNLLSIVAFLSALFYLFNLGTLQQFYAPFEMFPTQYAALPWIILFSLEYLSKVASGGKQHRATGDANRGAPKSGSPFVGDFGAGERQDPSRLKPLLWFGITTLLATPQAYAAHLWYPFFGVYVLFLFMLFFLGGADGQGSRQRAVAGIRNEHWREGNPRQNLKKIFTLIILTLIVNSFWFLPNLYFIFTSGNVPKESKQNRIFSQEYRLRNRENGYLKDVALAKGFYFQWSAYNNEKDRFEYLMPQWRSHLDNPAIQLIGYTLFALSMLGLVLAFIRRDKLLLSFFPFFIVPFIFLMNHTFPFDQFFDFLLRFSLSEEALRFVYTKFSILLIFSYTIYLSYAIYWIATKINKHRIFLITFYLILLATYCFPYFTGNLISDNFKIKIPNEYFQLWTKMQQFDDAPMLTLPLHTFSGWQYYNFGYQGSGFMWFGMKQPVLDRDSDRWSVANEQAFRELQYTLYSERTEDFYATLQKFGVGYVLIDLNVITPTEKNRRQILFEREIQNTFQKLVQANLLQPLVHTGNLYVFKNAAATPHKTIQHIATEIQPQYRWNFVDTAFTQNGTYITTNHPNPNPKMLTYPFRDVLYPSDRAKPNVLLGLNKLQHPIQYDATRIAKSQNPSDDIRPKFIDGKNILELKTNNYQRGVFIQNDSFAHKIGYVLAITGRNIEGLPLRICLKNLYSNLCELYDELSASTTFTTDYFIVPPYETGIGYGLAIDNISYGNYDSVNQLENVTLYPLAFDALSKEFTTTGQQPNQNNTLVFNQAFNNGWIAVNISNFKVQILKNHVLVNNWANGWILPSSSSLATNYTIVFWPQILEFFGFFLLLFTPFVLVICTKK